MDRDDHLGRERGLLGQSDREYLLNESDVERDSQQARNIRARIRTRVTNALLDFDLLLDHLEERDREQVFEFSPERSMEDFSWTQIGITSSLAFLYDTAKKDNQSFEEWLERGIRRIESSDSDSVIELSPVNVSVHIEEPEEIDIDEVRRKYRRGDLGEISGAELFLLIWMQREGEVGEEGEDLDEIFDAIAEQVDQAWGLSEKTEREVSD
jgi:hypothetical protein